MTNLAISSNITILECKRCNILVIVPGKTDVFHEVLLDMYRKYGPLAKQTIGGDTVVYLFDPEDIKVGKGKHIPPHPHPLGVLTGKLYTLTKKS